MKREISISAIFGIINGVLFILIAIVSDIFSLKFDAPLSAVLSLAIIFAVLIQLLKKSEGKKFVLAVTIFVISSAYSVSFFYDAVSLSPNPEQQAYMHLLSKIRDDGKIDRNWKDSTWNFLSPKCYAVSISKRYDSTSLEIAVFSYRYSKTQYDPNGLLKIIFTKLFCGYADAKTAYEEYKRTLSDAGFELNEKNNSFSAENDTLIVYCDYEGGLITVIKANKKDEDVLKAVVGRVKLG